MTFYAHTKTKTDGKPAPESEWERLEDHLQEVAKLAGEFADAFGAKEWGELAGLWHDLGKYLPDFQLMLKGTTIKVEHSGAGAALAQEIPPSFAVARLLLAAVIAGHHSGLPDLGVTFSERIKRAIKALATVRPSVPVKVLSSRVLPELPQALRHIPNAKPSTDDCLSSSFLGRMVFSALVDADSLETEKFCNPNTERSQLAYDSIDVLRDRLDAERNSVTACAPDTWVNRWRSRILSWCRDAAEMEPGFFSLNVPTGGGKTLSAMSFALRHAAKHGLRRVIIAVPYTSIIEQNAGEYAKRLGAANVLEHHSNLDDFAGLEESKPDAIRRQLAAENWDAPVVVTTNVQLFESLLHSKRSRCRKLHRVARSVIILDEAQCLPNGCLNPVLHTLRELVAHYGCTVVLSTATQPALELREKLPFGLTRVRPIIPPDSEQALHQEMQRVSIDWSQCPAVTPYTAIAAQMAANPCSLAIVHRKADARVLTELLASACPGERLFHLSTSMCPVHRRRDLEAIRAAMREWRQTGTSCRVVSTQLIEAGVDLDFPVVYRALAGLDSIAQAAGRCNREGLLDQKGKVIVFRAETDPPKDLCPPFAQARAQLEAAEGQLDLCQPSTFQNFFKGLTARLDLDQSAVIPALSSFQWATAAEKFKMIRDEGQVPVIIPFDVTARERLAEVRQRITHNVPLSRSLLRSLQPYTINVFSSATKKLAAALTPLFPDSETQVLNLELWPQFYNDRFGLAADEDDRMSITTLCV